ncbi:MAG: cupin domain-containing protein [Thermomicrobiales bacterium]
MGISRRHWIGFSCLLPLLAVPMTVEYAHSQGTPEAVSSAVERDVLGSDEPSEAPGEILEFSRYTIPAGAVLPIHKHPGVQMAVVISGTLTYHVISDGTVPITRANGTKETAGPGVTVTFTAGDAWVEPEGMIHYAENLTDQPVILLSPSLFQEGEPTAELVDATPEA